MAHDGKAAREAWLTQIGEAMAPHIAAAASEVTGGEVRFKGWRVSCGWPHKGGLPDNKRRVRGECWPAAASTGGLSEIFISPVEHDAREVTHILAHELIHALLPAGVGHKRPFPQIAKAIGLTGKATATEGGPEFWQWAEPILSAAGPYPHDAMAFSSAKKKSKTYLVKCECETCGYTVRATQKHIDVAAPICPDTDCPDFQTPMRVHNDDGEDE